MIIYIKDKNFSDLSSLKREFKEVSKRRRTRNAYKYISDKLGKRKNKKDDDKDKKNKSSLKKKTKSFTGAYLRGITSSLRGDNPNGVFGDIRDTDGGVKGAVQGAATGIFNGAWKGGLLGLGAGAIAGAITGNWDTIPEWGLKGAAGIGALGGITGTINGFRGRDY